MAATTTSSCQPINGYSPEMEKKGLEPNGAAWDKLMMYAVVLFMDILSMEY
uniref:Uncharacterized protein n=1 Tax=Oryza sativa subsp. japonica TaxID=39947 RepID=Q6Z2X4_ORYSJ|nr:hypothetical protein [Oryza sativa Japonica Group]